MDKILVKLLESSFGRSFITGVFIAMAAAVSFLALHNVSQMKVIQALNDEVKAEKDKRLEAERLHRVESDARWRADIERSQGLLERIEQATKIMKRRK